MMSAEWIGRQVATGTFTALTAGSLDAVTEMSFGNSTLYIDTTGGTFGGTQKTSTLLGFDLSVSGCAKPVFTGDGELYFTFVQALFPELKLDLTLEYDTTGVGAVQDFRDQDERLLRLKVEGASLSTASSYSKKTLIIDMAGQFSDPQPLGDIDGDDVVTVTFNGRYNETASDLGKFIVVNELSALG